MEKNSGIRIAHLSDIHFSHLSYNLRQFLTKRWIGNLNLLLFRKRAYQSAHVWHLPELLSDLKVDAVFITGDFTSTSIEEEFTEAKNFIESFKPFHLPVYVIPGNHDCYTKGVEKHQCFYKYLHSESLKSKKLESIPLPNHWWYIGLDCAVASPPFCAFGRFFETTERFLQETLDSIPPDGNVIIANHFPLFTTGKPTHDLKEAKRLQELLKKYPQVKLYLHGHDHSHYIIDKQNEGFPLVVNSGSCAHKPDGTFFMMDLFDTECLIQRLLFRKENATFSWSIDWQKHYSFQK